MYFFGLCVVEGMSGMIYLFHFIFILLVLFLCLVCTTNYRKGRKVFGHNQFLLEITMLKFLPCIKFLLVISMLIQLVRS